MMNRAVVVEAVAAVVDEDEVVEAEAAEVVRVEAGIESSHQYLEQDRHYEERRAEDGGARALVVI